MAIVSDCIAPTVPSEFRRARSIAGEDEVRQSVRLLFLPTHAAKTEDERRRENRRPFPYPFRITPIDANQQPLNESSLVVIGKNLSELGIDFYHREPLPFRHVIASFDLPNGSVIQLLLDLTWCRFGQHGVYDSGGRFLRVVPHFP